MYNFTGGARGGARHFTGGAIAPPLAPPWLRHCVRSHTVFSATPFYQKLQKFFFIFTTVLGFWRSTGKKNFLLSPLDVPLIHYNHFHRSHRQTLILIDSCCFIKTAASRHQKSNISVMPLAGLTSHFFDSSILNRFPSLTLRLQTLSVR